MKKNVWQNKMLAACAAGLLCAPLAMAEATQATSKKKKIDIPSVDDAHNIIKKYVKLINAGLARYPEYLHDIRKMNKEVKKVREHIKKFRAIGAQTDAKYRNSPLSERKVQTEAEFLKEQVDVLYPQINDFVDYLYGYKLIIRPVFDYSQQKKGPDGKFHMPNATKIDKFFDTTEDKAKSFLSDHTESVEYLEMICQEFERFSAFLLSSLDNNAKVAYKKFLKKVDAQGPQARRKIED